VNGRQARELADTWLGHLRRDSRGLPVPWINRWGPETIERTRVAYDGHAGRASIFHDDHGDTPDYTKQNMGRQRQAVACGLCQVCGRPVPWSRRYLVLSRVSAEHVSVDDVGIVLAISEPWLDQRCAMLAVTMCPALIRLKTAEGVQLLQVTSKRQVELVLSVGSVDEEAFRRATSGGVFTPEQQQAAARLRAEAGTERLGMWLKIAVRDPGTGQGPAGVGGALALQAMRR
jgi:hypothetical protein